MEIEKINLKIVLYNIYIDIRMHNISYALEI